MPNSDRIALSFIAAGMVFLGVMVYRRGPGFYRSLAEGTARRAGIPTSAPNPFMPVQTLGKWLSFVFGICATVGGMLVACMVILGFLGIGPFR